MSGKALRAEIRYQGLLTQGGSYCRSDGFNADVGFVLLDYEQLKKLRVEPAFAPWRAASGFEWNGQLSIQAWHEAQGQLTASVTSPPPVEPPGDGGLRRFGDLEMSTFQDGSATPMDSITYKDIQVMAAGMEEIYEDLARAEAHDESRIRVPVTDVRRWYPEFGALCCEINVRYETGGWKPTSVKKDGSPFDVVEVCQFLFSQLPGSPTIYGWSTLYQLKGVVPTGIIGEGEPVVEHLQRLLERYQLVPKMQVDNNYVVSSRLSSKYSAGKVPAPGALGADVATGGGSGGAGGGSGGAIPGNVAQPAPTVLSDKRSEKKTFYLSDRPPVVMAFGKRVLQRITLAYVPVLQDVDGLWYRLEDLVKRWGYSLAKLNKQVFVDPTKRYSDVPPLPGSSVVGTNGPLHARRRKILERAYLQYAPAALFARAGKGGGVSGATLSEAAAAFAVSGLASVSLGVQLAAAGAYAGLTDADFQHVPYLPVKPCPLSIAEVKKLRKNSLKPLRDEATGAPLEYVLSPPLIWARRVTTAFFTNFAAVETWFEEWKSILNEALKFWVGSLAETNNRIANEGAVISKAQLTLPNFSSKAALDKWKALAGLDADNVVSLDGEAAKLLADAGVSMGAFENGLLNKLMTQSSRGAIERVKLDKGTVDYYKKMIQEKTVSLALLKERFDNLKSTYENYGGFQVRTNVGPTLLEEGVARIDPQTGILNSSEPLVLIDQPFIFDGDEATVQADGAVTVSFGYESKDGHVGDWTTVLLMAGDDTDDPPVQVVGMRRSSPVKCKVVRTQSQLVCLDKGTPINGDRVVSEALSKCAHLFKVPRAVEGYVMTYDGMRNVYLDEGCTSVEHTWDGDDGYTRVGINAPNTRRDVQPGGGAKGGSYRGTIDEASARTRETLGGNK